jgi:hypothetical protein
MGTPLTAPAAVACYAASCKRIRRIEFADRPKTISGEFWEEDFSW